MEKSDKRGLATVFAILIIVILIAIVVWIIFFLVKNKATEIIDDNLNEGNNVSACTDTCSSLGYKCGVHTVCGKSVNCGKCSGSSGGGGGSGSGGGGSGGGGTTCTDTCSSLAYQCGIQTICGNVVVCGNCPTGYTCNNNGLCTRDCSDTCSSLGYNCGIQMICGNVVVCGNCPTGQVCNVGTCVNQANCTDTCATLNYQCGSRTICGNTISCGSCGTDYTCQANGTCIKEDTNLKYIVENGVGHADIVVSSSAPNMVKLAANYFQMYINNMTGVTLPISNTPSGSVQYHVYIGQSSYTDALGITSNGCRDGGFKMVSGSNYLVLLGEDTPTNIPEMGPSNYAEWDALTGEKWMNDYLDNYNSYSQTYDIWEEDKRGSMNAVYEFLYDQGIRWYYPGWYQYPGIGTIIPEKEDVGFGSVNSLTNPDFSMREFFLYTMGFGFNWYQYDGIFEEMFQWELGLRGNSYYEFSIGTSHGIRAVIARLETEAEHPEYYATIDGVLMNGDWPVPDLCSPELLAANIRYVKKMFDIYNISMISVAPTDGFTSASDRCTYMEDESAGYYGLLSNYVWEYVNNVAWAIYNDPKYTGKKILCDAYTTYLLPPEHLSKPVAPNLVVNIAKWRSDNANETIKEFYENLTNWWLKTLPSKELYTGDYYLHNSPGSITQSIPYFFPHLISEDLKFLKGKSQGEIIEISSTSEWPAYDFPTGEWKLKWDAFAANSFNTYVTSRLYWDADQDIDALLEEYYTLYYGPVREQMKAFVEYSEAHIGDVLKDPIVIRTMKQMLKDARTSAGDTIYGHRIDLLIGLMNSTGPDEVTINSCQLLNSPAVTYKLTADVTSTTGTCFTIFNVGVTLDCQGHTITYGTSGETDVHAVVMPYSNGIYKSTVKNCNIRYTNSAAGSAAIVFPTSIGATIENNIINVPQTTGIFLGDSSDINVIGNTIISSSSPAFFMQTVSNGIISNNKFSSSSGEGMYLYDTHNVSVIGNNASSISNLGVHLVLSTDNTLTDNRFTSVNSEGVGESQCSGNVFLRNIILP